MSLERIDDHGVRLFRFERTGFPQDSAKPVPGTFEPSSEDKRQAAERGLPVLLSVWDRALVAVKDVRRDAAERAFVFTVAALARVDHERLAAFRDEPPVGHCGIAGLERSKGEDRNQWRALLSRLADACDPLQE